MAQLEREITTCLGRKIMSTSHLGAEKKGNGTYEPITPVTYILSHTLSPILIRTPIGCLKRCMILQKTANEEVQLYLQAKIA